MGRSKSQSRISKKISILEHEGIPHDQAIATAINMEKKHRITESGAYVRVKKRRK